MTLFVADAVIFLLKSSTSFAESLLFLASFSANCKVSRRSWIAFLATSLHLTSENCFILFCTSSGMDKVMFPMISQHITMCQHIYKPCGGVAHFYPSSPALKRGQIPDSP